MQLPAPQKTPHDSLPTELCDPDNLPVDTHPAVVTSALITRMALLPKATMESWRDEVRILAIAAASNGDFKSGMQGMEMVGKSLGQLSDNPQAAVLHLHNPAVAREATDDALEQRLQELRTVKAEVVSDPSDDPDDFC